MTDHRKSKRRCSRGRVKGGSRCRRKPGPKRSRSRNINAWTRAIKKAKKELGLEHTFVTINRGENGIALYMRACELYENKTDNCKKINKLAQDTRIQTNLTQKEQSRATKAAKKASKAASKASRPGASPSSRNRAIRKAAQAAALAAGLTIGRQMMSNLTSNDTPQSAKDLIQKALESEREARELRRNIEDRNTSVTKLQATFRRMLALRKRLQMLEQKKSVLEKNAAITIQSKLRGNMAKAVADAKKESKRLFDEANALMKRCRKVFPQVTGGKWEDLGEGDWAEDSGQKMYRSLEDCKVILKNMDKVVAEFKKSQEPRSNEEANAAVVERLKNQIRLGIPGAAAALAAFTGGLPGYVQPPTEPPPRQLLTQPQLDRASASHYLQTRICQGDDCIDENKNAMIQRIQALGRGGLVRMNPKTLDALKFKYKTAIQQLNELAKVQYEFRVLTDLSSAAAGGDDGQSLNRLVVNLKTVGKIREDLLNRYSGNYLQFLKECDKISGGDVDCDSYFTDLFQVTKNQEKKIRKDIRRKYPSLCRKWSNICFEQVDITPIIEMVREFLGQKRARKINYTLKAMLKMIHAALQEKGAVGDPSTPPSQKVVALFTKIVQQLKIVSSNMDPLKKATKVSDIQLTPSEEERLYNLARQTKNLTPVEKAQMIQLFDEMGSTIDCDAITSDVIRKALECGGASSSPNRFPIVMKNSDGTFTRIGAMILDQREKLETCRQFIKTHKQAVNNETAARAVKKEYDRCYARVDQGKMYIDTLQYINPILFNNMAASIVDGNAKRLAQNRARLNDRKARLEQARKETNTATDRAEVVRAAAWRNAVELARAHAQTLDSRTMVPVSIKSQRAQNRLGDPSNVVKASSALKDGRYLPGATDENNPEIPTKARGGEEELVKQPIWWGSPPRVIDYKWVPKSELIDTDPHSATFNQRIYS